MYAGFYPNSRCLNPIFWYEKWHVSEAAKGQRTAETVWDWFPERNWPNHIQNHSCIQNWGHVSIAFHGFACAKEKAEGFDEVKFLWDAAPKCGWTAIQWFDHAESCEAQGEAWELETCQKPLINNCVHGIVILSLWIARSYLILIYISYYIMLCAFFGGELSYRWYRK